MKKFMVLFIVFILIGCAQNKEEAEVMKEEPAAQEQQEDKYDYVTISDDSILVAVVETNFGTFEMEFFPDKAPKTVTNFVTLANEGFYDSVTFHRVIDGFVIQGGDPTGTGSGGKSIYDGKPYENEIDPTLRHDSAGVVAMANAGPNTNTSQFYITLAALPNLDGGYTVFGRVINGMDVVYKIGKVPTEGPYSKPINPVIMEKVTIEKRKK